MVTITSMTVAREDVVPFDHRRPDALDQERSEAGIEIEARRPSQTRHTPTFSCSRHRAILARRSTASAADGKFQGLACPPLIPPNESRTDSSRGQIDRLTRNANLIGRSVTVYVADGRVPLIW